MLPQWNVEEKRKYSEWVKRFAKVTKGYHDVFGLLHFACGDHQRTGTNTIDIIKSFVGDGADPISSIHNAIILLTVWYFHYS